MKTSSRRWAGLRLCSFHLSQSLLSFFSLFPPSFASFLSLCHPSHPFPSFVSLPLSALTPSPKTCCWPVTPLMMTFLQAAWIHFILMMSEATRRQYLLPTHPHFYPPPPQPWPCTYFWQICLISAFFSGIVACKSYWSVLFVLFLLLELVFEFLSAVNVKLCVNATRHGQFYNLKSAVYAQFF